MFSDVRIDTFFFGARRRSAALLLRRSRSLAIARYLALLLEGLFAVVVVARYRLGGASPASAAATATAAAATGREVAAAALVALDLRGREAQARADVVGDDLDDVALVAFLRLPRALLEPAGHHDPRALAERLAHVLRELAPAHDVEEARRLLPLAGPPVLPAPVHRDTEAGEPALAGPGDRKSTRLNSSHVEISY